MKRTDLIAAGLLIPCSTDLPPIQLPRGTKILKIDEAGRTAAYCHTRGESAPTDSLWRELFSYG